MRVPSVLLGIGGGIFVVLGLLHAFYTFLDIRRPRRLVPDDSAVSAAMARSHLRLTRGRTTMWQAWVGFNFSHSLGVVLFGALSITTGTIIATVPIPGLILLSLFAIGLVYVLIGALYWFRIPVAGAAIATTCLLLAWLTYVTSSSN
jgi:energy-converting hydrogenase Eha subunit C